MFFAQIYLITSDRLNQSHAMVSIFGVFSFVNLLRRSFSFKELDTLYRSFFGIVLSLLFSIFFFCTNLTLLKRYMTSDNYSTIYYTFFCLCDGNVIENNHTYMMNTTEKCIQKMKMSLLTQWKILNCSLTSLCATHTYNRQIP